MRAHQADEMLAGFGALRVVRDEEGEGRRPQERVPTLFSPIVFG